MMLSRKWLAIALCGLSSLSVGGCLQTVTPNIPRLDAATDRPDVAPMCVGGADCSDNISCTVDECVGGRCTHRADDSLCADDGVACTVERCVAATGCQSVPDSSRCPADQVCREEGGAFACRELPICSREGDPRCNDGQDCTTERCDVARLRCVYEPRNAVCDDGRFCNGTERCEPFRGCTVGARPTCNDDTGCTRDSCDEMSNACAFVPDDMICADNVYCNGDERCDPMMRGRGCVAGGVRTCDDSVACTNDRCDEAGRRCVNQGVDRDMDGDPQAGCGGGRDCNDMDPTINSRAMEVCNQRDDNCDGRIDEGTLGACGDCDPSCRVRAVGAGAGAFDRGGSMGVAVDPGTGALQISAGQTQDYLWIPNTNESTLSKWDASTGVELARYRVGLAAGECRGMCCHVNNCNMPSRVVIDGKGDAYIANRGFTMQGTVNKVAASRVDCVDRNGNGMIDTSTGPLDVRPFGQDECMLWTANVGPINAVLRSIAIDRGSEMFPNGTAWVGSCQATAQLNGNAGLFQLNPNTGQVLRSIPFAACAYGAVVTADGTLWEHTLSQGLTPVNTMTGAVGAFVRTGTGFPMLTCANGTYGITADARGRIWLSRPSCRDSMGYDPMRGTWTRVNLGATPSQVSYGITTDANGRLWIGSQNVLYSWPSDAFVANGTIAAPAVTTYRTLAPAFATSAIGADRTGNIWFSTNEQVSPLIRYVPAMGTTTRFDGPNRVYTYTDFTGSVRRAAIGSGTHNETFDGGCASPVWNGLVWDAATPMGTSLVFSFQTASTQAGLDMAPLTELARVPNAMPPVDLAAALRTAGVRAERFGRVSVQFTPQNMPFATPSLRALRVQWYCR